MKKNHMCKILSVGIIVLFVGVSVSSAISVDTKSTISNNQSEECKSCGEVSKSDLIKVKKLLDKVEVYSKLLLVLSRFNPELRQIGEEISTEITTLNTLDLKEEICDFLESISNLIHNYMSYLANLQENSPVLSIRWIFFGILLQILQDLFEYPLIFITYGIFDCYYYHP